MLEIRARRDGVVLLDEEMDGFRGPSKGERNVLEGSEEHTAFGHERQLGLGSGLCNPLVQRYRHHH